MCCIISHWKDLGLYFDGIYSGFLGSAEQIHIILLDYKYSEVLNDFVTERGKIVARRVTGTCALHQRSLTTEIKRARQMALMFYTATHSSEVVKKSI